MKKKKKKFKEETFNCLITIQGQLQKIYMRDWKGEGRGALNEKKKMSVLI